jgi:hypothetical protein
MKIIIENKENEKDCCVLDTAKAIAIRVEPFNEKHKLMTITYEYKFFSYTDEDCNFYTITHTMDGVAHKKKVNIETIFADFSFGVR